MAKKIKRDTLPLLKEVLIKSFKKFTEDDIFTHAAALSYYTIFSLPPILLVILSFTNIFYDETVIKSALFEQISNLVSKESASELLVTLEDMEIFQPTIWATVIGVGALIFTSTTVFITLQNALNKIFGVKAKPKGNAIFSLMKARLLSFSLLIGVAFILMVSLVINTFIERFGSYIEESIGFSSQLLTFFTSICLPLLINTLLFAIIFKFLPDAKLKWKHTWFGALFTSFLFVIGRHLINLYIGVSSVSGIYDTAGSIMVIMVWVFYASIIVMYGSVITHTYIEVKGAKLKAEDYAVKVEVQEVEAT